jgi:hypothetical protein
MLLTNTHQDSFKDKLNKIYELARLDMERKENIGAGAKLIESLYRHNCFRPKKVVRA